MMKTFIFAGGLGTLLIDGKLILFYMMNISTSHRINEFIIRCFFFHSELLDNLQQVKFDFDTA